MISNHSRSLVAKLAALAFVYLGALFSLPATAEELVLEEVLVTATRRGTSDILTTPTSMTALDGEDIEKYAIRDLNDIAVMVPSLSAGTVSAFKSASFAMR